MGPLAARMADIEPFHVMALLGRARELEAQGRDIVHMEIGEPDFATPEPVLRAAQEALAAGRTHYTPALGLPALRERIAGHYRERYRVEVDPARIIITPGASGALLLALGLLVSPGEEVLLADPGYPCNRHFVRFTEGVARALPVDAAGGYQLSAEQVAAAWSQRSVAAMVASPSNPTGTLIDAQELEKLAAVVHQRGGALLVDEIYQGLVYDTEPQSVLSHSPDSFVINSFSKYFCMTGWRLGWLVVPQGYIGEAEKLVQNLFIAAPTLSQYAAVAAFAPESIAILEAQRRAFAERRDYLYQALEAMGFGLADKPQGAFYLYADCSRFDTDSYALSQRLLEEAGVAVTPGLDFGSYQAETHLRFAYTTSLERLQEGVGRLQRHLGVAG
jgi:aspartate/methionine/tyrosine aminotransferase